MLTIMMLMLLTGDRAHCFAVVCSIARLRLQVEHIAGHPANQGGQHLQHGRQQSLVTC